MADTLAVEVFYRGLKGEPGNESSYTAPWVDSVLRTVSDKLEERRHIYDLIDVANRNSTYDCGAELQAALDEGGLWELPSRDIQDLRYSAVLTCTEDNAGFYCPSRARLLHTHTTNDMLRLGDGTNPIVGFRLENIAFWSTVTKSAGYAINARFASQSIFTNVYNGDLNDYVADGSIKRIYNGYYFDRFNEILISGGNTVASNELIKMRGNADQTWGVELRIDDGWRGIYGAVGTRQGGACGGIYYKDGALSECVIGQIIDETLQSGVPNREAFWSEDWTTDASNATGVIIDQSTAISAQFIFDHAWISSTGRISPSGSDNHALWIKNAQDCTIHADIHGYNNLEDAIRIDDADAYVFIPSTASLLNNGGYGINPTVAAPRLSIASPRIYNNTLGAFNPASNSYLTDIAGVFLQHLGSGDLPYRVVSAYTGTLNGSGNATIAHGLTSDAPKLILMAQAFAKDAGGTAYPITVNYIDGTNISISGASYTSRPYKVILTITNAPTSGW